jgi:pantoate--beta-alanine ligase
MPLPLEVLDTPAAMAAWSRAQSAAGHRVVLVPTMGALHEGHLRLVDLARRHGDVVVVSIFVNPLQFDRRDDFDRYPRPLDGDLALCQAAGAAAVYAPTAGAMYPPGFQTHVEPGRLADPMEGAGRPGHFRGVTTVVTKLFNAVRPDAAVFGQKDFQQLAIVRRMVIDLDMGIEIVAAPTVREADGLAMSSRNRRLTEQDRSAAACVPRALDAAAQVMNTGERRSDRLLGAARAVLETEPRARLEYVSVADADTLEPLDVIDRPAVIAAAVWFGEVRLIDNRSLRP